MGEETTRQTREERLAARLRDNLRRRKAQARALHAPSPRSAQEGAEEPDALPNPPEGR